MNDITYFKRLIYDSEYHEYYVVIISLDSEKASTIEKLSSTILIMNKKIKKDIYQWDLNIFHTTW